MSTSVSLPLEVMELILEALAIEGKDIPSVKAFSLVCRSLRPRCEKHLFGTICLFEGHTNDLKTATKLLELLEATPALGPCIRVLGLFRHEDAADLSILPAISQQLTKLHSLYFSSGYDDEKWDLTPNRHTFLPLLHLPTLTHLMLVSIDNFFVSDLIPCTGLKNLEITSVTFNEGSIGPPALTDQPITIDRLSMAEQSPQSLRPLWGAKRTDGKPIINLGTVKALDIRLQRAQGLEFMNEFFGCEQHLVEFEVKAAYNNETSFCLNGLYDSLLRSSETLKHLKFGLPAPLHDPPMIIDAIRWLIGELGELSGRLNSVETIEFAFTTHLGIVVEQLEVDEWGILERILWEWPALKLVSLAITFIWVNAGDVPELLLFEAPEACFGGFVSSPTSRLRFDLKLLYHPVSGGSYQVLRGDRGST